MEAYIKRSFRFDYKATIGADFLTKKMDINGESVTANIWDTAGQERLSSSLNKQFYRGSDGCVIVFDLTDANSFSEIEKWVDSFLLHSASRVRNVQDVPNILIGNKSDLVDKRMVKESMAKAALKCNGFLQYFETSAKDLKGVDEAFNYIIQKAVETMPAPQAAPKISENLSLLSNEANGNEPKKGCCGKSY